MVKRKHILVEQAVRRYLKTQFAEEPQGMQTISQDRSVHVIARRPFPPAELHALYNKSDAATFHRYFLALFRKTENELRQEIERSLGMRVQTLDFVINAPRQELDILIEFSPESASKPGFEHHMVRNESFPVPI